MAILFIGAGAALVIVGRWFDADVLRLGRDSVVSEAGIEEFRDWQ